MRNVLCVDIGNSNTVFGLFQENSEEHAILRHWRTVTRRDRTSDELGVFLLSFLKNADIDPATIVGFVYSSVVPSFNPIVERMAHEYFDCTPLRVTCEIPLPLNISYPRPQEIGADRLVNAVAGSVIFGGDLIMVDLGTATTFCIVHDNVYIGGTIAPGLKLSMEALSRNTAQLPPIEFRRPPEGVLGMSTLSALQAGFYYGWLGLLKEIILRLRQRDTQRAYRVIATGGLCSLIHQEDPGLFDEIDSLITLRGLKIIYQYQRTHGRD